MKQNCSFIYFAIVLAGLLMACENDTRQIKKMTEQKVLPIQSTLDVHILYSEEANLKVSVKAPLMERFNGEKPYREMPEGIDIVFYDSAMNVTSKLTANYAIDKTSEHIMEAKDDVVVINEKKEQLNTEHLIWDQKNARIYSDKFVKITTADEIIMGEGFESNQEFTKYTLKKPKGTLSREDD